MTKIVFGTFMGASSSISPELLPQGYATEATNVFTDSGSLNVWRELNEVGGPWNGKTGTLTSLFLMDNSRWLAWTGAQVNVALVQKQSNLDWEVIFTGTDKPRYTNRLLAVSGGGHDYPEVSYPIGIPVPTAALIATVSPKAISANSAKVSYMIAGTVGDAKGDRVARTYIYTFVNDAGREGAPSTESNTAYSNNDEQVTLTRIPAVPQADIHKIRVYVAASGGTFNYLKEITIPTGSNVITDNKFGAAITTTLYTPPPNGMIGITAMANGMLAGYKGNDLYFSEQYQSHAWPEDYITPMDYPIKGIVAHGNMLYISTEGYPVIATGNSPSYMSFTKLGEAQACISTRSMVGATSGALYAAADGIVLIGAGSATMITEEVMSKRVFRSLNPSSIHGYYYRGKYVGFYDSGTHTTLTSETGESYPGKGAFILEHGRKVVTFTDEWCDIAYSDTVSGRLYMVRNISSINHLYTFDEGSGNLPFAWTTQPIVTPETHFAVGKIRAKRYPLTFQLYADNVLKYTKTVTSSAAFRLPGGYRAVKWAVRLSGDSIVDSITLAESMLELR
jgi:hypothetical protein